MNNGRQSYFQHYEHPADIGIRGVGQSREEAFRQAGLAMMAVMVELDRVKPEKQVDIEIEI